MWECAIRECSYTSGNVENLLTHQVNSHEKHQCKVCGTVVPDGYFAIQHMFSEHSRADYLRKYEADTADIRRREKIKDQVDASANLETVVGRIKGDD